MGATSKNTVGKNMHSSAKGSMTASNSKAIHSYEVRWLVICGSCSCCLLRPCVRLACASMLACVPTLAQRQGPGLTPCFTPCFPPKQVRLILEYCDKGNLRDAIDQVSLFGAHGSGLRGGRAALCLAWGRPCTPCTQAPDFLHPHILRLHRARSSATAASTTGPSSTQLGTLRRPCCTCTHPTCCMEVRGC